jgi:mRNA interferase RelE/StbE
MASYHVDFKPSVYKDFRRLPESVVERVMKQIEQLQEEPLPHGVEKLETAERLYRIRIGDYRIVMKLKYRYGKS